MEERYNPKDIEPKWQAEWERAQLYLTREDSARAMITSLPTQ